MRFVGRGEAVERVKDAWLREGINPQHHRHMQWRLHREWPVLARALEDLASEGEERIPLYNPDGSPLTNDEIREHAADILKGCPNCGVDPVRCCKTHSVHSMPHRGCILR